MPAWADDDKIVSKPEQAIVIDTLPLPWNQHRYLLILICGVVRQAATRFAVVDGVGLR